MNTFRPQLVSLEDRSLASASPVAPPPVAAQVASATPGGSTLRWDQGRLAVILATARAKYDVPALAGGVILDGKLAGVSAVGHRERGEAALASPNDRLHLGSNGKAMTATLAAILVERGVVRWDSKLAQVFPELKGIMNPAYRNVTLQQLLNHRSGLADANEELLGHVLEFRGSAYAARATFLAPLLRLAPANPAGQFSYSNTGYTVAATMLERAAGRGYESLMRQHIFHPLGMTSAGFGPPGRGDARLSQPRGHDEAGQSVGNGPASDAPAILNPAGLVHMNMADWSKFLRVHLGEAVNGKRLLSAASLAKLHTPDPRPTDTPGTLYGFGWVTVETPMGRALWHNGSNGFWYSEALLIPGRRAVFFAVSNQAGERGVSAVEDAVAAMQPSPGQGRRISLGGVG